MGLQYTLRGRRKIRPRRVVLCTLRDRGPVPRRGRTAASSWWRAGWLGESASETAAGWWEDRAGGRHAPWGRREAQQRRKAPCALGRGWAGEACGVAVSVDSVHEFSASESSELLITTTRSSASPGSPVEWLLLGRKTSFPMMGLSGLEGPSRGGETALEVLGLGCSGELWANRVSRSSSDSILMAFLGHSVWQDFLFWGVTLLQTSSLQDGSLME